MLSFIHKEFRELVEMTAVICKIALADDDDSLYLKLSPEMLSLMTNTPTFSTCNIALQLFPPFFHQYICHQTRYSWIYVQNIYPIMFHYLEQCGITSLTFSLPLRNYSHLTFHSPNGGVWEDGFALYPFDDSTDVGEFNLEIFVSIDSQYFLETILTRFHVHNTVFVFITSSQVEFRMSGIILTVEISERCIIGGVGATDEIVILINLNPMETFMNLAAKSKRVWLFRSRSSCEGVLSFPVGLHARFLAYFPRLQQPWQTLSSLQKC